MKICSDGLTEDGTRFGSKNWASVYLASTPQQAASMGLKFPGVDEVIMVLLKFLLSELLTSFWRFLPPLVMFSIHGYDLCQKSYIY